jgi:tetratricopeptide (TPR) repeat protein
LNRNVVIALVVGLVAGGLVGYSIGHEISRPEGPVVAAGAPGPANQGAPAQNPAIQTQQRVAMLQQVVAREPKNVQAWVQLGNDLFDLRQAQPAVDAYARALELQPDNPDVLTDQGVMFRELRQYDRAVANFLRANEVQPRHLQSLYNAGIVFAYDLNQPEKAIQAWNKIVASDPQSQQALQARAQLEELKARKK